MEKDNPQPQTQPSGNKPPPRPPTRTAIAMLPGDEDPEKNRGRHARRENVRINLSPRPSAASIIQLPLLPSEETQPSPFAVIKSRDATWPVALLLILAIWAFIGAIMTMALSSVYSDNYHWNPSRNLAVTLILLLLWAIPARFIRYSNLRAGRK
jgi:hypothetical protein